MAIILAVAQLTLRREELPFDTYFVFTTLAEGNNPGMKYAASHLPGDITIAVEVGPVMSGYSTHLSADPIIDAGDKKGYYSREIVMALADAAKRCVLNPQYAPLMEFVSDASAGMVRASAHRWGAWQYLRRIPTVLSWWSMERSKPVPRLYWHI